MARIAAALLVAGLVALCTLTGINAVTRVRKFTPDSMVYVDSARNVLAGRGLAFDALPLEDPDLPLTTAIPVPLSTFPPLYPLAIAAVARTGIEAAEAALLVAALAWALVLALGYLLARRAWGEAAARLGLAALVLCAPLHLAGSTAWSETLGVALVLAALLALPLGPEAGAGGAGGAGRRIARAALAGLLAGLAFATRYALAPLLVLGPVAPVLGFGLERGTRSWRRGALAGLAFVAAAAVPVALVMRRNFSIDGTVLPDAGAATTPWLVPAGSALRVLFGQTFGAFPWPIEAALVSGVIALALLFGAAQRRERPAPGATLLAGWTVLYPAFLVFVSSRRAFDALDARLLLPAAVTAVFVGSAIVARGFRVGQKVATLALVAALVVAFARELQVAQSTPARTTADEIAASPRLTWLTRNTTPRDLLVGDDAVDLAFYARRRTLSFEAYPGALAPTPERIAAYWRLHRAEYDRCFLVLSDRWPHTRDWARRFGPFFGRLATGRDSVDAGATIAARVDDGTIYRYAPLVGWPARSPTSIAGE